MKVLLHAAVDLSRAGGLETHVRELALGLAARGHAVDVFGTPGQLDPFRMVSRLEPARYDIVHHHGGVWPRGLDPGPGYVRTFHFSVAAKMRRYLGLGRVRTLANVPNWIALADERASARRAAAIVCVSAKLAGEIAGFHGVPRERIDVIPNGASFDPPAEPREALRARHGLAADARLVLTIGRDDFVKGTDLFARAWARAAPAGATWVQVGGRAPAKRAGRLVIGDVSRGEIASWIHAADVGAFPSYYEGGGIVLLDFLAAGLYTLAHDVGNAAEVIRAGENGELVSPDVAAWEEALPRVLAAAPRGRGGLPDAFRWPAIVRRTEEVYARVLAGRGAARNAAS